MNYAKKIVTCLAVALISGMSLSAMAENALDDATVTAKVKTALIENKATKAHQIDVDTRNGVVQLNGFVDTADAKSEAESAARTVSGVKSVQNNLQVRSGERTMGNALSDAEITAKVKSALIGDSRTKAYQIEVKTYKGVVSLGGFVASSAEKDAAEDVAKNVNGVAKVENGIKVGR
jgi:hyperosmotically inducible protein